MQQQTISGEGLSGIAFSTNVPHTVRGGLPKGCAPRPAQFARPGTFETKMCSDCHVSKYEDNNAVMAQLLMHGTNFVNFIGRYCWVGAGESGLYAVEVTEREEPQAVIGSSLHALAYPDDYREHVKGGCILRHAHEHPGKDISDNVLHPLRKNEILSLQARGEYLYAACGEGGLRVFDIAFIDDKGFSERITTAPVSPLGQRFFVATKYAAAVASPATIAPDPTRSHRPENCEQKVAALYGYLYVADKYEGLILVGAGTLLDGNPLNNFLKRNVTFNPDGLLCGARNVTVVGNYAYVCCDAGLVVVALDDPTHPKVACVVGSDVLKAPTAVQVQFRFGYVCDSEGIKVLDVTRLDQPRLGGRLALGRCPQHLPGPHLRLRGRGQAGAGDSGHHQSAAADRGPGLQRGRLYQRPERRETGYHQRQRVRVPGRRLQRSARAPVDFAGNTRFDRLQPAARAQADRDLPDAQARPRPGNLQGSGPRSGRR